MINNFNNILINDAKRVSEKTRIDNFSKSNITITGASGLIGINIISSLIFYNLNSPSNKININALTLNKPKGFFLKLLESGGVNFFSGDITDPSFLKNIPPSDFLVHGAGYGQPIKFLKDKIKTISINTSSTINLINNLLKGGSFLFLSTSEVYSGNKHTRHKEENIGTTDPYHSRSCYIEGKRTGETIVNSFRQSGINAVSARIALGYGPGIKMNDTRVLNQFIQQGMKGSINLLDNGNAIRTYCYISDVIIMLLNLLYKSNHNVYNVGGKSKTSIKELAMKIGKLMNVPVSIPESKSFLKDSPKNVSLDLCRIENEFGHHDYVDLNLGIKKTIEWIKCIND